MPRTTDWRSPQAVDALLELDRADLAWEFLKRNPDYREDFRQTLQRVATGEISEEAATMEFSRRWGYPVARDPDLPANESPTIWRPELIPLTVVLVPAPEVFSEAHELTASDLAPARASVRSTDGIQIVVEDRRGDHRVWLREPKEGQRLAALLPLDDDFRLRVLSLVLFQRRLAGRASGPPPKAWLITRRRRRRLILMVRALDGHLAEASYREIADALYGTEAVARYAWKTSSIRGQTIRLVQDAVRMMRGGYRELLRGD
jgi:hypothetical protein